MEFPYNLIKDTLDHRDYTFLMSINPHQKVKLPKKVDLRSKCPPVFDQGKLGSCTANAGVSAREMLLNDPSIHLSRLFLYYNERSLSGNTKKDSGASMRDLCKALQQFGICEEKFHPYDINKFAEAPSVQSMENALKYKINSYKSLTSLEQIKQALALSQKPVLMGITVYESMETKEVARTGILPLPKPWEKKLGGHAVLIIGYNDGLILKTGLLSRSQNGYLIVRNSWGDKWGKEGYFYMPYSFLNKGNAFDYWVLD